jgi:hypothetical protein
MTPIISSGTDPVSRGFEPHQVVAAIEAGFAALCAAVTAVLVTSSFRAARWAERTYGHNVDSGAIEWMMAILFFAPAAVLLAVAALSLWRRWRIRLWLQGLVAACLVGLFWAF